METINNQLFRHLWKSYTARIAALWLAFWILVILLGYLVIPDSTQDANSQLPEYAKAPPCFSGNVLIISQQNSSECASHWYDFWFGKPAHCERIFSFKEGSLSIQQEFIHFTSHSGLVRSISFDPKQSTVKHYRHTFWLGSDVLGRDVLSRLFLGARISLSVGFWAVLISLMIGVPVGLAAGYFGGILDKTLMGMVSILWAIPTLMLAMSLAFVLGKGYWQMSFSIGLTAWVEIARIVRSQTLVIRSYDYVVAGKVLSFSHFRIFFRHILPNIWGTILILAAGNFSTAILMEAGLSFLGMGIQPPTPSWGAMIYEGYAYLTLLQGKWLAIIPGCVLMANIIAFTVLGNELRDFMNPQKRPL